ncbi:MAG: response regulator [Aquificota bacterium]|nr:response regulator [Aquificota bacterium]
MPLTEVIVITGHGTIKTAVEAMKLGAFDFLTKPCSLSEVEITVRKAIGSGV